MHLRADNSAAGPDGYEVWGASIPGVPCVQIGHNRFIAWGITAALCDDVEIYREKMHRLDPDLYLVGRRWQKLESRKELIAVRGAKLLEKIVRASRHGPAISDFRATSDGKEILTARWTAHARSPRSSPPKRAPTPSPACSPATSCCGSGCTSSSSKLHRRSSKARRR